LDGIIFIEHHFQFRAMQKLIFVHELLFPYGNKKFLVSQGFDKILLFFLGTFLNGA